jgi:hypothetical protein
MAGLVNAAEAMRAGDLPAAVHGAVPGAELAALLPPPSADGACRSAGAVTANDLAPALTLRDI